MPAMNMHCALRRRRAALMYCLELLYGLIIEIMSISDAHKRASDHTDDRKTFEVFSIEHEPPEGRGAAPRP